MNKIKILCLIWLLVSPVYAKNLHQAITKPIPIGDIADFKNYSPELQDLIKNAHKLSSDKLTYLYGSASPKNKGMDCSGTIQYLLKQQKITAPRQANDLYTWVKSEGTLHNVKSNVLGKDKLKNSKPGDLLFWTGTYKVKRTPPITHVMLYLGKNKEGQPLMFGSSNGRPYQKKSMWGVSVFDFTYPRYDSGKFVAYGCIPGITCETTIV